MQNFYYENLSFYYGKKIVINNLCLKFNKGDIIALVGYNGVGKTTLLKLIAGVLRPQKYTVSFLIEKPCFYPYMTGIQNLQYFSMLYNKTLYTAEEVLKMVGLWNDRNLNYHSYSYGMKQKLGIAKCLLQDAEIYLFDEPLNGIDAIGIKMFRQIVQKLKSLGKSVIISSHILGELDKYCNKLFILKGHSNYQMLDLKNENSTIEYLFLGSDSNA